LKNLILFFFLFTGNIALSQELYINTEPASLIPKGSKVVRLTNSNIFLDGVNGLGESLGNAILLIPSVSYGISKKLMVGASIQFSNNPGSDYYPNFGFNGFKIYSKQRILSTDKKKFHTRLSSFIKYAYHENKFMENNLDLEIQNSGMEFGLVGTQLINKLAISVTSGFTRISNISDRSVTDINLNLIKNSLSMGYLVLPRKYTSYKQTNFNIYLEYITSTILNNNFPDRYNKFSSIIAPGIQFILLSRSRIDFSYKIRKSESPEEFLIKLTYIIY
jgi:hypothetical protein